VGSDGVIEQAITQHLKRYLGDAASVSHSIFGAVDVLRFVDRPSPGAVTYATHGLSRRVLKQESGDVRQELLMTGEASWQSGDVATALTYVAGQIALAGRPLLYGDALPLGLPVGRKRIPAILAIDPRYFDEGLHVFAGSDPPTAISWLVPITEEEFNYVMARGHEPFLKLVAAQQPDLLKLGRRSVRGL
jgi:hypothetical protein